MDNAGQGGSHQIADFSTIRQMFVELKWELPALFRLMSYMRYLNSYLYFQEMELGRHESFYIPSKVFT